MVVICKKWGGNMCTRLYEICDSSEPAEIISIICMCV